MFLQLWRWWGREVRWDGSCRHWWGVSVNPPDTGVEVIVWCRRCGLVTDAEVRR